MFFYISKFLYNMKMDYVIHNIPITGNVSNVGYILVNGIIPITLISRIIKIMI